MLKNSDQSLEQALSDPKSSLHLKQLFFGPQCFALFVTFLAISCALLYFFFIEIR